MNKINVRFHSYVALRFIQNVLPFLSKIKTILYPDKRRSSADSDFLKISKNGIEYFWGG
jgi:hypothetical protein